MIPAVASSVPPLALRRISIKARSAPGAAPDRGIEHPASIHDEYGVELPFLVGGIFVPEAGRRVD